MVDNNDLFVELLARRRASRWPSMSNRAMHLDRTLALIRESAQGRSGAQPRHAPLGDRIRAGAPGLRARDDGQSGLCRAEAGAGGDSQDRRVPQLLDARGCTFPIEVDGNVSFENIPAMVAAGARIWSPAPAACSTSRPLARQHGRSQRAKGIDRGRGRPSTTSYQPPAWRENQHMTQRHAQQHGRHRSARRRRSALRTAPVPQPRPGKVRVRIGFCGVCGSDIPRCFVKGTYKLSDHLRARIRRDRRSLSGRVSAGFDAGDRVAVFPLLWCGDRPACEQGQVRAVRRLRLSRLAQRRGVCGLCRRAGAKSAPRARQRLARRGRDDRAGRGRAACRAPRPGDGSAIAWRFSGWAPSA